MGKTYTEEEVFGKKTYSEEEVWGPTIPQKIGRQVGLTGRYAVEGALSLPSAVGDVFTGGRTSKAVSDLLTKIGLSQPSGAGERVVGDITRSMAGGALFGPGAIVPGGVGAGASGATREMGGGPVAQMGAGLVAPFAVDGMKQLIIGAYRGVKAVSQPVYPTGRERIAGRVLTESSGDAAAAKEALRNADDIVPGSQTTVVQATRDPGLATLERGIRSTTPGATARFAQRDAAQNRARSVLLDSVAKDKAALDAAFDARDKAALPILQGIRQGDAAVDAMPVVDKIDAVLKGEAGKRSVVRGALKEVRENLFSGKEPESSFSRLYGVRKDLSDMIEGRVSGERASHKYAAKELIEIRDALDDQIQAVYPQFSTYREAFKEGSKTINQIKLGQEIAQKTTTSATTSLGDNVVSAAKWRTVVTQNKDELSKTLSPDQMKMLEQIGKDLDAGAYAISGGKAAGSNTIQNASTAYLIGSMFGGGGNSTLMQTLFRPFSFITKLQDKQINELLTDAMLDPRLARSLMLKATPRNTEVVGKLLAARAKQLGLGAAAGQVSQTEQ